LLFIKEFAVLFPLQLKDLGDSDSITKMVDKCCFVTSGVQCFTAFFL